MTTPENPEVSPETPSITATPAGTETTQPETAAPQPAAPKPAKKKSSFGKIVLFFLLFLIIVLGAAAGGGWYYLKHHVVVIAHRTFTLMTPDQLAAQGLDQSTTPPADQSATQSATPAPDQSATAQTTTPTPDQSQQETASTPAPAPTPAPTPAPAAKGKKPSAGNKKSTAQTVAPAPVVTAGNQSAPSRPAVTRAPSKPTIPSVSFDPFKLDKDSNARLKIDPAKFPAGLTFVIYMDGQILYTGNTSNREMFDKFVIPPGVHQMQLALSSGNVTLTSNIVSEEFKVQKHLTFKVEFRAPNAAQANSPVLDPSTQLVARLKNDLFHF